MIRLVGVLAVLALGWFFMPWLIPQDETNGGEGGFASDRLPAKGGAPVDFNGKRAMGCLEAICDIGPRLSGSEGMAKQQALIVKHFEKFEQKVEFQRFSATQVSRRREPVEMANLIVSYHPERKRRVIICSHYDTRPIADQEKDELKWRGKFVSANDGGSGVAFLMEFAHHMKDLPTKVGVDFVFFDGEEYIFEPGRDEYFFGSKHFARTWQQTKNRADYRGAVLLDMIAGKNARFPYEGNSWRRSGELCVQLWKIADELQCRAFVPRRGEEVLDDHIALQNVGIPAIDLIDFSYPHWHKLSDVPANCGPEGMTQVAKVLSVWLQRLK